LATKNKPNLVIPKGNVIISIQPQLTQHQEMVIAVTALEPLQAETTSQISIIYTEHFSDKEIGIVNCYQVSNHLIDAERIVIDRVITLYKDANLQGEVVALHFENPALLSPKALELMLYLRAWQEALLTAIPWLGIIISGFMLAGVLNNTFKKPAKRKLKFTFSTHFYLLTSLFTLYPLIFTLLGRTELIIPCSLGVFLLLGLLNVAQTKYRNKLVESYRQSILNVISREFSKPVAQ
jgi:hypothetical protein